MDKKPTQSQVWPTLSVVFDLGFRIAIPLVFFALLGRWLDKQFETGPWLFLSGILFSIIITSVMLVYAFKNILKKME